MSEQPPLYGAAPITKSVPRVRIPHLKQMKVEGKKWAMLTAYDMYSAAIFEEAGIPVLLVGDSASNNVYGNASTLSVTVDELIPLVRAVSRSTHRPLIVADLPFGSYQASAEQCFHTAVRFMKEAGAHAIKIEGGGRSNSSGREAHQFWHPGYGPYGLYASTGASAWRLSRPRSGRGRPTIDRGRMLELSATRLLN